MHLFGFPLSHKEEENPEMISHTFRKVTEARGEDAKEMWREVMTEQKTLQTLPSLPNPVQNKEKHPQKLIKIKCSLIFYRRTVFVFGNAHTQHAFTKGQCCVSAILDLLLQFWTSEWCHGAKMEVAF